jgi:hypothetical protein
VKLRYLAASFALLLATAAPASAADVVLRTFDKTELESLDAYRDRVAWTEDDGTLMTVEGDAAVAVDGDVVGRDELVVGRVGVLGDAVVEGELRHADDHRDRWHLGVR